ncbi:MAG TPA: hypothetical protein VKX17_15980 [Planctomycetota bacterium]|nr:hypothetical protein [Planctomycetota bacterium]
MFPQDDPQQTPQNAQTPANSNAGGAAQNGTGSLISAPNDPAHAAQKQRELPVFWLIVLGALSLCAVGACGNLILRNNEEPAPEIGADDEGVPVVSEEQEIKS